MPKAVSAKSVAPTLPPCSGELERNLRARGYQLVAGADEAGRGSLFGAVYAAAVILSPERPIRGLNDSKLLEPERREELALRIRERAVAWAVAAVCSATIDSINIYQASRLALKRAVDQLQPQADFLIADALFLDVTCPQQSVIHGDALCHCIAAASILAKVERDACMRSWDEVYPEYGLGRNKGYSAPEHLDALRRHGPTPLHRISFEPVRACTLFPCEAQADLFAVVSS